MPNYQRLTDRALATGVTVNDLIHIVITGDTSQNPAGSSYKATLQQVSNALATINTYVTGYTYNDNTFTIFDNSGNTYSATIDIVSGLTINGDLVVTGNTNVDSLTATTISATTYQNLPPSSGQTAEYVETTDGTQVTGTTTATISRSYQIPGGRIGQDCIIDVRWGITALSNNTIQPRLYINTTNSLVGATQIAAGVNLTAINTTSNTWRLIMVDKASEKFRIPQNGTSTISNWLSTATATSPSEYVVDLDNDIWLLFANHQPAGGSSVVYFASVQIIEV